MIDKAIKILRKKKYKIFIQQVPGILEAPTALRKNIKKYDAFIVIGCVIKGKTPHFDLICKAAFNAFINLSIDYNKPITNGVITALNKKQAFERCGILRSVKPNKGLEAAKAVINLMENGPKKFKILHPE